jgi:quercetin 2,3-dioxygenase
MSETTVAAEECSALGAQGLTFTAHPNREASLGTLHISRALPIRDRRMVGPWCFLDRFGPLTFAEGAPMNVPPHPHIGIQTVSWLLEGEVLHSDSLGYEAVVRPGGVNVMTAGSGIAHAEETPQVNSGRLNGVQLWVALPEAERNINPRFDSVKQVPIFEAAGGVIRVFAGAYGAPGSAVSSPAPYFSEIIGADVEVHPGATVELGLNAAFEHAALLLGGDCAIENQPLQERTLYYLGRGRAGISLVSQAGGRVLLIGGPPFPEKILMWWNFVARTPEEIAAARSDWEEHRRFGEVTGEHGPRLAAPDLVRFARPNPIS